MDNGWISLHRALSDHWLWKDEKFTKGQAWVDLILHANHSDTKTMIKGQLFEVKSGQQLRSKLTLSKLWKWDRKTVTRFLSLLEKDGMITQQTTHQTTIISICNYSDFQDTRKRKPQRKGQQKGQARPNGRDTDNNVNNVNKVKDIYMQFDFSSWPEKPIDQTMKDWIELRKTKKAKITQTVINTFGKQLSIAEQNGFTVEECMTKAVTTNWTGFEASWMKSRGNQNEENKRPSTSRAKRVVDELDKLAAEDIAENGYAHTLD